MRKKLRTEIAVAISTLLVWLGFGTLLFHRLEDWTWIQSFYFSVITLTTVGYGDLSPSTDLSRLVTALYILIGVGAVVAALGVIGAELLRSREQRVNKRSSKN